LTIDGRGRAITDICDPTAVYIEHRNGLKDIIELAGGERNGDILIVADPAKMFEVADPVLV